MTDAPAFTNNEIIRRNIDESVSRLLLPFAAGEAQESLKGWVNQLITSVSVWTLPSPNILKELVASIHNHHVRRDFVFSLSTLFQIRMELDGFKYNDVILAIAKASHLGESGSEKNIMLPNLIEGRFSSFQEWVDLLATNKWLVPLLVLMLYGSLHQDSNHRQ